MDERIRTPDLKKWGLKLRRAIETWRLPLLILALGALILLWPSGKKDEPSAEKPEAAQTEVKIQIKIDTGLHRVGVTPGDELEALLKELSAAGERIKLAGVYSHFADTAKPELCRAQAELLLRSAEQVESAGFAVPMRHICDSAGSEYYPEYHFDAVRLGRRLIMDHPTQPRGNVRECASWRSCIMAVHRRHAGEKLGYGGVYTLDHDADVAIVGVG